MQEVAQDKHIDSRYILAKRGIAESHGWRMGGDNNDVIYDSTVLDSWKEVVSWSGDEDYRDQRMSYSPIYSTWHSYCEGEEFEIVSSES